MSRETLIKLAMALLGVTWLFVVTLNYYVVHKPFTLENALAILNTLGDLFVAMALFFLAAALGRKFLSSFQFDSSLEEIVFSTGMGLGIVAFGTFALGLVGWLSAILFWLVLLIAFVILRKDVTSVWRTLSMLPIARETRFEIWLARFCGFALVVSFIFAICPPIGWDGLQYHLVGPKLAIAQGRISTPPDNWSLNYPALVEMLFLAAMQLKSDNAAQLMHWGYLLLSLGAVLAFAQRYFSTRVGWLAAAILVAVPSFLTVSTWAYNDLALTFYTTAALILTLRGRETSERRWFVLAGVFAGMAMGEKYTAVFLVPVLIALIVRPQRQAMINVVVLSLIAGVVAAPWFIRNWIFVGNPIYPFVWGGLYWDSFRMAWYSRAGTGLLNEPLRLILAPWQATILGSEQTIEYDATIGALLLMLIPLRLLAPRLSLSTNRSDVARRLWFFVGAFYLIWLIGIAQSQLLMQTRLLFPAFPVIALLAADSFDRLAQLDLPQFSFSRFSALVIGLVLALTAVQYGLVVVQNNPLAYLTGYEGRDKYLQRTLGDYYAVVDFINKKLPTNARILFLWETRPYYIDRTATEDPILDRWAHLRFLYHDPDRIADDLQREGYSHILLYRAGMDQILQEGTDPLTREDLVALQDLLDRRTNQVYGKTPFQFALRDGRFTVLGAENDRYAVYEITPPTSVQGQ